MVRRVLRAVSAIGLAGGVILALSGGAVVNVCPAIMHLYSGPAVLDFAEPPAGLDVAACFGSDCEPAAVNPTTEGVWEVPQEAPYLSADTLGDGSERMLRVRLSDAEETVADEVHEIPVASEPEGVFGQCPGPFWFEPVPVELP